MLIEILSVLGLVLANLICYACHHKSLLRGRLQGPKLIFISNRSAQHGSESAKGYWALDALDPAHLVSSPVLNDVSILLLRVLSLVFFAVTLLLEGLTGDGFGNVGGWFTFFTNWTFLLFGVWSAAGVLLTGWYVQAKLSTTGAECGSVASFRNQQPEEVESLTGVVHSSDASSLWKLSMKWGPLSVAYLFMTETVATASLFLSFFYWTVLFSPRDVVRFLQEAFKATNNPRRGPRGKTLGEFTGLAQSNQPSLGWTKFPIEVDNVLKHGVNNGLLLLEVLLCRVPFVSYHYQVCLLYGTAYTLFMWGYHAASLHWVYYVLDWSRPTALALYTLNPLFLFAAFAAWYLIASCREWLASKLQPAQQAASLQQVDFR